MRPYELIKLKRDGNSLEPAQIQTLMQAYAQGEVPDYQMASLLMAVFFRGMSPGELRAWTQAMLDSGQRLDLSDLPGTKVDKHSTGGVGDKVSLSLAPLVAACGVTVPMMSGRGLGHTGGTLDKLETIPGFRTALSLPECRALLRTHGLALMAQTSELVPADRKLYALRDVTATVDCLPLIASSILSKKLAEGMDALVLDVKVGSGAFLKGLDQARALAKTLIDLGREMGHTVIALLTDMEQPLGRAVGNALELKEALDVLRGQGPADVTELTFALGAEMLVLGGAAPDIAQGRTALEAAVASGAGLRKLAQVVEAQGGDPRVIERPELLPTARASLTVPSPSDGYVSSIDAEAVGHAAVALGAGRSRLDSAIDPAVGFILLRKVGDPVRAGEPLVEISHSADGRGEAVVARVAAAYRVSTRPPTERPLVIERMEGTR